MGNQCCYDIAYNWYTDVKYHALWKYISIHICNRYAKEAVISHCSLFLNKSICWINGYHKRYNLKNRIKHTIHHNRHCNFVAEQLTDCHAGIYHKHSGNAEITLYNIAQPKSAGIEIPIISPSCCSNSSSLILSPSLPRFNPAVTINENAET